MKDCKRVECMGSNGCIDLCWKKEPKQEQGEPVGEVINERGDVDYISYVPPIGTNLYTTPQQRKPLTNELADALKTVLKWVDDFCETDEHFAESVEAKADAALEKYEAAHGIKE